MDEGAPLDRQWEATIVDHLSRAVSELLKGSRSKADAILQEVSVRGPERAKRKGVPLSTQLEVFRRDSFTCRYCSQRTLFLPTVRVLSEAFPEHLPVDPGWKLDHTHPVYWTLIASAHHVVPAIRGGGSGEDNLVTSCWRCNDIKRAWSLQELRWTLLEPHEQTAWDGLSGAYPQLCSATTDAEDRPLSELSYHRGRLRAFSTLEAKVPSNVDYFFMTFISSPGSSLGSLTPNDGDRGTMPSRTAWFITLENVPWIGLTVAGDRPCFIMAEIHDLTSDGLMFAIWKRPRLGRVSHLTMT